MYASRKRISSRFHLGLGMVILDFVVVPFSLTNSPTTFMCLMNSVFRPYLDKFVVIFIDDILVYFKNEEDHVENLVVVLRLLREHLFYVELSK